MIRRWFAHRFLTRVRVDPFGEAWVERPDWWQLGAVSGVHRDTLAAARVRLDEWQDEMYAARRGGKP